MKTSSYIIPFAAALALSGFVVAGAWTSPNASAPSGNVAAPINVGSDSQTKLGSLILNADTNSPDMFGLDVFGDSRIFGRLTSDTDICVENDTQTICLSDLSDLTGNYSLDSNTSCELVFDSLLPTAADPVGVTARTGWVASDPIPAGCYAETGCVIKQEIYSKKGLHRMLMNDFYQDPTSNVWSSTHNRGGSRKNGNTTSENIVKAIGGDAGYLLVRDDRNTVSNKGSNAGSKYTEIEPNRISFYDTMAGYGHKIYFCATETVLTEDLVDNP